MMILAFVVTSLQSDSPRRAQDARAQPIGLFIADEFLLDRVPFQRMADPPRDVSHVPDRCGPMADFHVAHGTPPRANALQPVLVMIVAGLNVSPASPELVSPFGLLTTQR